jgi:hypothetical protein
MNIVDPTPMTCVCEDDDERNLDSIIQEDASS